MPQTTSAFRKCRTILKVRPHLLSLVCIRVRSFKPGRSRQALPLWLPPGFPPADRGGPPGLLPLAKGGSPLRIASRVSQPPAVDYGRQPVHQLGGGGAARAVQVPAVLQELCQGRGGVGVHEGTQPLRDDRRRKLLPRILASEWLQCFLIPRWGEGGGGKWLVGC